MGFITIFGGTFNPIHTGHKEIIHELSKSKLIEKTILMPTKIPPHKDAQYLASSKDRYNMCEIIASDYNNVEVSDIEISREGKSYTIDTVNTLCDMNRNKNIAITIGGDMLISFTSWKDYKDILLKCAIIVFKRADIGIDDHKKAVNSLKDLGANVIEIEKTITDISSTEIRNDLLKNQRTEYLDPRVNDYILKNKLYGV